MNIFDKIRRSEVLHQSISYQQNWMVYPENCTSKGKVVIEDTEMHHFCNFKKHLVSVGNLKRIHPCSLRSLNQVISLAMNLATQAAEKSHKCAQCGNHLIFYQK